MSGEQKSIDGLLDGALCVRDLCLDDLVVVDDVLDVAAAQDLMNSRGFDVLGIRSPDGGVGRFVRRRTLDGSSSLADVAEPINADLLVESRLPIGDLLTVLQQSEFVFVLDGRLVRHLVNRSDLSRPVVGLVLLGVLLELEQSLTALALHRLGSQWFEMMPARMQQRVEQVYISSRAREADRGLESVLSMHQVLHLVGMAEGLEGQLNLDADLRGNVRAMRNSLAHGRPLMDSRWAQQAVAATDLLRAVNDIRSVTAIAKSLADHIPSLETAYGQTVIEDERSGRQYAGPHACAEWPFESPAHVLTAWNPDSRTRLRSENEHAQALLRDRLARQAGPVSAVTGRSVDGRWREPSLLTDALSREEALEIAAEFGQRAIFEMDEATLSVVDTESGAVRACPRIATQS